MADSKDEWLGTLAMNPWFGALPIPERKAMLAAADIVHLRAGEMLYRKGDATGGFYCVVQGAFKVSTLGEDGRELAGARAPLLRDRDFVLMAGAGDIGVVAQEVGTRGHLKEGKA